MKKVIEDLREGIRHCETPHELAQVFGLDVVELANHWSELHSGRSRHGILISDREDYEVVRLAVEIHGGDGEFGQARRRDGEHHSTFNAVWGGLEEYQKEVYDYFSNSSDYFYKSQEGEEEYILERIRAADNIEAIQDIINEYEELEEGYYDCNGTLIMPSETLDDPDFTGYGQDVYSYSFCYDIGRKYSWKESE